LIDEYGGTDGLVSIEDIIEEIVGDIADEHDEDAHQVRKLEDGLYLADARIDLEDFRNQTGIALAPERTPTRKSIRSEAWWCRCWGACRTRRDCDSSFRL